MNTAPQVSNRVYGREKYLNCNYRINFQCQRGQVVWELYSRAGGSESVSSNLCVNNFFFFVDFFSVSFSYFFFKIIFLSVWLVLLYSHCLPPF